jgi:hypothetical protein
MVSVALSEVAPSISPEQLPRLDWRTSVASLDERPALWRPDFPQVAPSLKTAPPAVAHPTLLPAASRFLFCRKLLWVARYMLLVMGSF